MVLRSVLSRAHIFKSRCSQVREICLIVDSRVIDSYTEDGEEEATHALVLAGADDGDEMKHKLVIRRNEPDEIAGFTLPKDHVYFGTMPELLGSKSYRPTRVDNEMVNELARLLRQGNVTAWEAEDIVRSNGGVLMPYHICEVLKYHQDDPDLALAFFKWADLHKGFEHDQFSCNGIIKILGKHKRFEELKMVVKGMEEQMIPVTYVTYRILLRSFVDAGNVEDALETFSKLENCEIQPTLEDYNYFMVKLIKLKCPQVVPLVFASMRRRKIIPTTVSYNLVISSLCLQGKMEEAYTRLVHMKKYCRPDEYTYSSLINGFAKCLDADKTLELLEELISWNLKPDAPLFNMMMDCHAKCGKHDEVIRLFERMIAYECKPDPKSYRVVVDAFAATGRIEETFSFLQKYSESEYAPNLGAYNTLMNRLGRANKAQEALEIYYKIKDQPRYRPDVVTYNIVLDLLGKVGRIQDAWECYLKMKSSCLTDAFTYNTMIVRLGKAGLLDMCLTVLEDMSADGIPPDHITYTGLIEGAARSFKLDAALNYLEEMKSRGLYPNQGTLEMLINALLKAGKFTESELLVQELQKGARMKTRMETSRGYVEKTSIRS